MYAVRTYVLLQAGIRKSVVCNSVTYGPVSATFQCKPYAWYVIQQIRHVLPRGVRVGSTPIYQYEDVRPKWYLFIFKHFWSEIEYSCCLFGLT